MHNFRRALISTFCVILSFSIFFSIIVYPCFEDDSQYNDSKTRQDLSGNIDYIFNGASHAFQAFDTSVIDDELGICSYNLSSPSASLEGRYTLLEKEISRNTLDTVVIDIAFDSMVRSQSTENATGEPMIVCKLDSFSERANYLFNHVSFFNGDVENVISIFLRYGLKAWKDKLTGNTGTLQQNKGFSPMPANNITLQTDEIINGYNTNIVSTNFSDENIIQLEKMINLCKQHNTRVIVAVIPISDAFIWKYSNLDEFLDNLKQLCKKNNCPVYDFNLINNRYEILNDQTSFTNLTHMSAPGASAFSKTFCDFIKNVDSNQNLDLMFYKSYEELKQDSPYMSIYQDTKTDLTK